MSEMEMHHIDCDLYQASLDDNVNTLDYRCSTDCANLYTNTVLRLDHGAEPTYEELGRWQAFVSAGYTLDGAHDFTLAARRETISEFNLVEVSE